ncbi:hypothetical protein ACFVDU_16255 [Streptomyces albidoflavus]
MLPPAVAVRVARGHLPPELAVLPALAAGDRRRRPAKHQAEPFLAFAGTAATLICYRHPHRLK